MKSTFFFLFIFFISIVGNSQSTATKTKVVIKGVSKIDPKAPATSFAPLLQNLEAPTPGGNSYKDFINQQKIKSAALYGKTSDKKKSTQSIIYGEAENPTIINEMGMRKYTAQIDKEAIYYGGTPLDNTMSVSPNFLLTSVNSFLWGHDMTHDSTLFMDENGSTTVISFAQFGKDYILDPLNEFPFDPKLLYIPQHNKFIFMFLSGRTPSDSKIIVGFSSTEDPRDPWNVYMLPGNPRNVDEWTDFPMAGFDKKNMYLSINLLQVGMSWQEGFKGSIIWQVPLEEGFTGQQNLNTILYDNIKFNGRDIRNLTPVQPTESYLKEADLGITFLSNRNFDIQNDSLFIIEINAEENLTTTTMQLPELYGMPPNGIQGDDDPTDETDGLQTNDARYLGAVRYTNLSKESIIEFVGNTKDFQTSRSAIYHGVLKSESGSSNYSLSANVIGVDSLDFGYPNIAFTHNGQGCYEGTMIAFNHTSATTFAGISGVFHSNNDGYSDIIRLKEGEDYVRRLTGSYERWGDYFGIQTDPKNDTRIFTAGFYGTEGKKSSTWMTTLQMPDTTTLSAKVSKQSDPNFVSAVTYEVSASDGFSPFAYLWSDGHLGSTNVMTTSDSNTWVTVEDDKKCILTMKLSDTTSFPKASNQTLFPNPVVDLFSVTFSVQENTLASFGIYDMAGKLIVNLGSKSILKGENLFQFSALPLQAGAYVLIIKDGNDTNIIQKLFVKI